MFKLIKKALKAIWNFIKRVVLAIINFFKNIVAWFRLPGRLKKLEDDRNLIAVAIKENLDSGNYNIINCLFNKETNKVDESDAIIMESGSLDGETRQKFSDKDMIILQ